jgi:hypothetical protein
MGRLTRDYVVRMPTDRWIRTACEDANCEQWRYGWDSLIDERVDCHGDPSLLCAWVRGGKAPCGACQGRFIRTQSGRTFKVMRAPDGLTVFRFESGQRCFAEHRTRPARLSVETGGIRLRAHSSLAGLAEDYTEHVGNLADQYQRG